MMIEENAVVLFQGDSVTDAGRIYNNPSSLGYGYPYIVASWFSAMYPEMNVRFVNRGVSGNRVKDLVTRWQEDCLQLKPTWVSILAGINDCWRRYDSNDETSVDKFESGYRNILTQVRDNLEANMIICEPFVLPVTDDRKKWREDLDPKISALRCLAREFGAFYVPLDGLFAQASTKRSPEFWAADGVHPSPEGHELIAQAWLRTLKAID